MPWHEDHPGLLFLFGTLDLVSLAILASRRQREDCGKFKASMVWRARSKISGYRGTLSYIKRGWVRGEERGGEEEEREQRQEALYEFGAGLSPRTRAS